MDGDLDRDDLFRAITEGVRQAIWQIATNNTDAPCADFYAAILGGVREGIENTAMPPPCEDDGGGEGRSIYGSSLTIRAQNALAAHGLHHERLIRQFLHDRGESGLLRTPNFGRKSLNDVMNWLAQQ